MDYDHLDPEGSLMEKIQALIQPPQSEISVKKSRKSDKEARKVGRSVNHDNCDSCGEGGDLLCCDRCPCAFHLSCCDPPLEEDDIPDGEWLCIECKSKPKDEDKEAKDGSEKDGEEKENEKEKENERHIEKTREKEMSEPKLKEHSKPESPFSTLVKMSSGKNPTTFSLPPELICNTVFPGDRKRRGSCEDKAPSSKNGKWNAGNADDEECGMPPNRLCFNCSRTDLFGLLVQCDFCPLAFHMDCLSPPLTTEPSGMWMCPNHAEHAEPGLRDPRFTKRCQAYNELRNNISQHTVKLNFLNKVHRIHRHPAFKRKALLPTGRRTSLVPQCIKDHYTTPPLTLLPEHVRKMQEPLPLYSMPLSTPTPEEQEEWLKCVVNLQCGIAKQLTQMPSNKLLVSNYSQNGADGCTTVKTDPPSATAMSTAVSSLAASTNNIPKDAVINGVKSELGSHAPSSSSIANACISRVVTTTITTSSGGKTITKPVTILYASPSKLQAHMNGPLNCAKPIGTSALSSQIAAMASAGSFSNFGSVSLKHEPTDLSCDDKLNSTDAIKLINDLAHLNNLKPKASHEGFKPMAGTLAASLSAGSSVTRNVLQQPTAIINALPGITGGKIAANVPTKLIVLTSNSSGNIIKTIGLASSSASQIPAGTNVTLMGTTLTSSPLKVTSAPMNTGTQSVTSVNSSPGRIQGVVPTPVATANAINSICAATGVDAFNETELGKLDPRLIQVLAYQRLQQLLTQTKPVPPSPVASRKITFNGLKETIILSQQAVPTGRSIAVLCPLTGTGPTISMIHKCLTIGKGVGTDVCLQEYSHCNFVSQKHCCIFYDETLKQYELINYSEHGTYVDNVLYSCDFSDKPNRYVTSSKDLDPSKVSKSKLLSTAESRKSCKVVRRTLGYGVQKISRPCNCTTSSSNLIGSSGAGWEGTALLHHGSYVKVGCLQFVFSITSNASKQPGTVKTSTSSKISSSLATTSTSKPSSMV